MLFILPVVRLAAVAMLLHMDADDDAARAVAQEKLDAGNQSLRRGDYAGALAIYQATYAAYPSPKIYFNIARCEEKLGRRGDAVVHYGRFLNEARDADPGLREEAVTRAGVLERQLVRVEIRALPAGAIVGIDGAAPETDPSGPLWLEPGRHEVSVRAAGRAWTMTIAGQPGDRLALPVPDATASSPGAERRPAVTPVVPAARLQTVAPPAVPPRPPGILRRWWLWAGLGAVLAGAIVVFVATRPASCPESSCVNPFGAAVRGIP